MSHHDDHAAEHTPEAIRRRLSKRTGEDYLKDSVLGALLAAGNLGAPSGVNFETIGGPQTLIVRPVTDTDNPSCLTLRGGRSVHEPKPLSGLGVDAPNQGRIDEGTARADLVAQL